MRTGRTSFAMPLPASWGFLSWATHSAEMPEYESARWHPIHFTPAIATATDPQCLACHGEILERRVRSQSPAGVRASEASAWYPALDTYQGEQDAFHRRHLVSEYAKQVMDLKCTTCHQGNDPREETAKSHAHTDSSFTQRKHVDPMICVMCHGRHNAEVMGVPPGDWRNAGIRTNRHRVSFLKADAIETAAKTSPDVCFGCHGGRSWYRVTYPYPRHPWPGAAEAVPHWAKDHPTASDPRFLIGATTSG